MSLWGLGDGHRSRVRELEPIGVIDIGSNSVRLVVYEGVARAPTALFNDKVLCGLGRSVATTNRLAQDGVDRALAALTRFRAVARILKVKQLRAIATAAVREASNGREFIAEAEKACGVQIQILSGEREAEYAAQGILMGFGPVDAIAGDLGGGSLELIDINGATLNQATTLPLGGLRLIDVTEDRIDKAIDLADQHISRVSWLAAGQARSFFAVGGTWRSLARLHMEHSGHPLRVLHGYTIATREAIQFCESVRRRRAIGVPGIEEISRSRRETLPFGALVLERLLKQLAPKDVTFSVYGIREGILYSMLPKHERDKDPLLAFCEDYARLRSRSAVHAQELCTWTDALFNGEGPKETRETAEERRLRHAACLMSDIGWRAHPDYRGEQSLNVIAHAGLTAIDHPGRVFLALSVYFRHVGPSEQTPDDISPRLTRLVDRRALKRARIVGAAIRTAHMLSIGMPGIIDEAPIAYERGSLVLTVPKSHAGMDGERLRRRFQALANLVEREPVVRIG